METYTLLGGVYTKAKQPSNSLMCILLLYDFMKYKFSYVLNVAVVAVMYVFPGHNYSKRD